MTGFVVRWIAVIIAVYLTASLLPGQLRFATFQDVAVFALVLGLLNAFIAPIIKILTFPITILTLGLFSLVVNAALFWLAASLSGHLMIDRFTTAIIATLVVSVVNLVVGLL